MSNQIFESRKNLFSLIILRFMSMGVLIGVSPSMGASLSTMTNYEVPVEYVCGNWRCEAGEGCSTCSKDCGSCWSEVCGDGICQSSESCSSCSVDCGSCSEDRSVIVYDATGTAKRYWADYAESAIKRSNLDGSQAEVVLSVDGAYGISYDPARGTLVWTSASAEIVQAFSVDGAGSATTLESSFEDSFAIAVSGEDVQMAYSVLNGEVVKITQDRHTGAEQREVLLVLSSSDAVHGLALTADHMTLYLGDEAGRMSKKLDITSRAVESLAFSEGDPPLTLTSTSISRQSSICFTSAFMEVAQ